MGILAVLGAITLIVGLVLTIVQFWRDRDRATEGGRRTPARRKRAMSVSAGPVKMNITTTYVGALIAALGAVLLLLGALTGK